MNISFKVWIIIFLLVATLPLCIYYISSGELTSREGSLLGVILTIVSVAVTWIVTHIYSQSQHEKAIKQVQEFHRNNLQTYAKKAAEKVNNLSNQLSRMSIYLAEELDRSDFDNLSETILSREERIRSAIHLIDTLKSVNDTALSDWEGVIGDMLDKQREEKQEKEEELRQLTERLQSLMETQVDSLHEGRHDTDVIKAEIEDIRQDLRVMVASVGLTQATLSRRPRRPKFDVKAKCPECSADIEYRQKPIVNPSKAIECKSCGVKLISKYIPEKGFVLGPRTYLVETIRCPSCQHTFNVKMDTFLGSFLVIVCDGCHCEIRLARTGEGAIRVTLPAESQITLSKPSAVQLSEAIIQQVKEKLPQQPWPKGIHQSIATALNLRPAIVYRAIQELIQREVFRPQKDGKLIERESSNINENQSAGEAG